MKNPCSEINVSVRSIIIILAGSGLFLSGFSRAPSFDVPLNEPVYRYLDMLPFPGRVNDISLSNRPFTEAQVCSLLVYAEKKHLCRDTSINNFYLRQFARNADGAPERTTPAQFNFDGCRTYAYPYFFTSFNAQDSNYSPQGFTTLGIDSIFGETEFYNKSGAGVRLYSSINNFLAWFDGTVLTEYSTLREWTKTDDPHRGASYRSIMATRGQPGHFMGYDDFTAYLKLPFPWCDVKAGNDRVSWGYADSSGLLFSGAGKPFLQLKLDKAIGKLNYTFLLGKLIGDTYREKRVIYAKHIAFSPWQRLSLGFSDAVISSRQEIDPIYFLPFVPFYFSQHYIGSPDNALMAFDGKLLLNSRWTAYGELFFDDLSNLLAPFRNNSWGDKWGGLAGIKVFNPLPAAYTSVIKAEIVQIEPWVYTTSSAFLSNEYNYPVHFGRVIGNGLGPHSRALTLDLTCQFSKKIGSEITIRQIWKGRGPGSNEFDNFSAVIDTAADSLYYENKKYRFENFDRNRTVVSILAFAFINDWLRLNCHGDLALERKPLRPVNLFSAGLDVQINY